MSGNSFNQPLGNWNVSNVKDMSLLFAYAEDFEQPIGSWDVSSVTNMFGTFQYAASFNQPLASWDVSISNARAFDQDIGTWDVRSVTTMESMFRWITPVTGDLRRDPHRLVAEAGSAQRPPPRRGLEVHGSGPLGSQSTTAGNCKAVSDPESPRRSVPRTLGLVRLRFRTGGCKSNALFPAGNDSGARVARTGVGHR